MAALKQKDVRAEAFVADLGKPEAMPALVQAVRAKLGSINVLQWTATSTEAGDLLTANGAAIQRLGCGPSLACCRHCKRRCQTFAPTPKTPRCITNGGFGLFGDGSDSAAAQFNAMGISVANAAKHKLTRVLAKKLAPEGIYVGELMVLGTIKGTAWDSRFHLASVMGNRFLQMYKQRSAGPCQCKSAASRAPTPAFQWQIEHRVLGTIELTHFEVQMRRLGAARFADVADVLAAARRAALRLTRFSRLCA